MSSQYIGPAREFLTQYIHTQKARLKGADNGGGIWSSLLVQDLCRFTQHLYKSDVITMAQAGTWIFPVYIMYTWFLYISQLVVYVAVMILRNSLNKKKKSMHIAFQGTGILSGF